MMSSSFRPGLSILAAALLLSPSSLAFDTPLSDTAVRQAYFLGQRRDETMALFLDKYTKRFAPPKTGPHISSITFFTPYALLVQRSSQHTTGYSAQQAEIDHRGQQESVKVTVQILLTASYPAYIPRPTESRSGSPVGFAPRPYNFWKDFQVQVFNGDKTVEPFSSSGEPDYICSNNGACTLTGATLQFEFLAEDFKSDSATIEVDPPVDDPVAVDFDLASLR
jgi:hypothetical protein